MGKLLLECRKFGIIGYGFILVSVLSVDEIIKNNQNDFKISEKKRWLRKRRLRFILETNW